MSSKQKSGKVFQRRKFQQTKSGKVFITNVRLCFYSNVLGVEVSFTAKWIQIASLLAFLAFGKGETNGKNQT